MPHVLILEDNAPTFIVDINARAFTRGMTVEWVRVLSDHDHRAVVQRLEALTGDEIVFLDLNYMLVVSPPALTERRLAATVLPTFPHLLAGCCFAEALASNARWNGTLLIASGMASAGVTTPFIAALREVHPGASFDVIAMGLGIHALGSDAVVEAFEGGLRLWELRRGSVNRRVKAMAAELHYMRGDEGDPVPHDCPNDGWSCLCCAELSRVLAAATGCPVDRLELVLRSMPVDDQKALHLGVKSLCNRSSVTGGCAAYEGTTYYLPNDVGVRVLVAIAVAAVEYKKGRRGYLDQSVWLDQSTCGVQRGPRLGVRTLDSVVASAEGLSNSFEAFCEAGLFPDGGASHRVVAITQRVDACEAYLDVAVGGPLVGARRGRTWSTFEGVKANGLIGELGGRDAANVTFRFLRK